MVITSTTSAQRYYGHSRNYYSSPRVYACAAPRPYYRPSVSLNFGANNFRYGHNYPSYYRPYIAYGPSVGLHVNVLPFGYYPFSFGNNNYYYNNNTFYRRYNDENYEVVIPPIGAKLPNLPTNAKPVTIDGIRYYELGGTYYQETANNNNQLLYEVVGTNGQLNTSANKPLNKQPIEGDIVDKLPEQSRTVSVNGQTFYVSPSNIYYQEFTDADGTFYKVVGR